MLSKFIRHLLPRIVLPLNPIFAVLPSYSAISFFYLQLSCNSLAGVHVQLYLFPGSLLSVYSVPKARSLPDECDMFQPRVSSQSF